MANNDSLKTVVFQPTRGSLIKLGDTSTRVVGLTDASMTIARYQSLIYEAVMLATKSGLQELFQASRTGIGSALNSAVKQMASAISQHAEPKTEGQLHQMPVQQL